MAHGMASGDDDGRSLAVCSRNRAGRRGARGKRHCAKRSSVSRCAAFHPNLSNSRGRRGARGGIDLLQNRDRGCRFISYAGWGTGRRTSTLTRSHRRRRYDSGSQARRRRRRISRDQERTPDREGTGWPSSLTRCVFHGRRKKKRNGMTYGWQWWVNLSNSKGNMVIFSTDRKKAYCFYY